MTVPILVLIARQGKMRSSATNQKPAVFFVARYLVILVHFEGAGVNTCP